MHLGGFREWIRQVYATQDEELDCEEFFEVIPKYVDMEIVGEDVIQRFPEVGHHLKQCPYCRDLYFTLRDAALLEVQEIAVLERQRVELRQAQDVSRKADVVTVATQHSPAP